MFNGWLRGNSSEGSSEILDAESASTEALLEMYEQAYIDAMVDDDGDLVLKDHFKVLARAQGDYLLLTAPFGFKEGISFERQLDFVNRINSASVALRAYAVEGKGFILDQALPLHGGVSRKTLVKATRAFFEAIPPTIGQADEDDIVE